MAGPGLQIKKRLLVLLAALTLIVIALVVRVAYIQMIDGEWLQKQAFEQQNSGRTISPKRGDILDRNGKELAISASCDTVSVNPANLKESKISLEDISKALAGFLGMDENKIMTLVKKKVNYVVIKKRIDKEIADKIRAWRDKNNVKGLYVDEDTKRYYINRNLAAQVVGFTGEDNQGLQGIEKVMDRYLEGTPGKILSSVDATSKELPFSPEKRVDAQDGLNAVLTIDETIQYLAQKSIEKAIDDYQVKGGAVALVMDPRNGDILAMVSKPDYDLNNPYAAPAIEGLDTAAWKGRSSNEDVALLSKTVWRNKAIADTYEPGSTFKTITTSAGIEEGVVTPDTVTSDFPIKVKGWPKPINCWRSSPHGTETFREAVYNSCNPAFVKVALGLGIDRFYRYIRAFGFYDRTGINLPGETQGIFHAKPKEADMAAASFGQRSTITPIQLISAYAAVANGGKLMKPQIVKELTDSEGNVVKKFEPESIRTVISKKTSETVLNILEGVVSSEKGTGKNAYVKGYRVAGKTGTAETPEPNKYYIASFSAIAPADNPVVCVLVVLFDPRNGHMGGQIAAPVAGKLTEDILNYLGVERRYSGQDLEDMKSDVFVPDVRKKTVAEAATVLKNYGLDYKVEGNDKNKDAIVVEQTPKPDASIPENSKVLLYTYKPENELTVRMPDLLNKTISEATSALARAGLNIKVTGEGVAVRQEIPQGELVAKGKVVEVEFRHMDNIE